MVMRPGPDAELFHVIAHGGDAAGMEARGVTQVSDYVLDFSKRDEITQRLLAGIEPHALTAVFRDIGAKQFFGLEAGGKEVHVINERVSDICGGQRAGELRLPHALGKPSAGRELAEEFFEIDSQARDLFPLIFGRNGNQDRYVEAAADRSEEHTSELQSLAYLVCRLLLEKK